MKCISPGRFIRVSQLSGSSGYSTEMKDSSFECTAFNLSSCIKVLVKQTLTLFSIIEGALSCSKNLQYPPSGRPYVLVYISTSSGEVSQRVFSILVTTSRVLWLWLFGLSLHRAYYKSCAIVVCRNKEVSVGLDVPPNPSVSGAITPNPLSEK
ncbi:hypothetical protein K503DRAFT_46788 [Rhizopogon vinicolor AM-OR11-026]|uniref:Uncharacterized protein n=1 Tax=Rhizopogon vinicolor AM-OR11-026 TaxID=1314800 RepID=A0A1B7MGW1_9AGAM|nr:hypothetical protein K503DRAFT_46788 [Rhizopogon vinicolor AM-OR11-026]